MKKTLWICIVFGLFILHPLLVCLNQAQLPGVSETQPATAPRDRLPGVSRQEYIDTLMGARKNPDKSLVFDYGEPAGGYAMAVAFEEQINKAGQAIWIIIRLKNVSEKEKVWPNMPRYVPFKFSILDHKNQPVPKTRYQIRYEKSIKGGSCFPYIVKHGETASFKYNLSLRFDLTLAGKYSIESECPVIEMSENLKRQTYILKSPPQEFIVFSSGPGGLVRSK